MPDRRSLPIVAAALVFSLHLRAAPAANPNRPLVFYGDATYAPVSYLYDGVPHGVDVDMANAIGRLLRRPVHIVLMDWGEAQRRVSAGEADGLLSVTITAERRERFDFTEPTSLHEFAFFARRDTALKVAAGDPAARIGVAASGFTRGFLERRGTTNLSTILNLDDGVHKLAAGEIDAFASDRWTASYTLERHQVKDVLMVGEPIAVVASGIAMRKGSDAALLADVNNAIRQLQIDGTLRRIQESWRPAEMVFMSRERLDSEWRRVYLIVGAVLFAAMAIWIATLMRQIRVRRHAEERFAKAFSASPDCIAIIDEDGVIEINDRFEEITGYSRRDVIGRRIVDLGIISQAFRDRLWTRLQHDGSVRDLEYVARRRDGVSITMIMSAERLQLRDRHCFIFVSRDITAQKAAEAALQRSETKYREFIENANDVILTVDRDGYCHALNQIGTQVTGRVAPDGRGVYLRELVAPEHAEKAFEHLRRALRGEGVPPFELDVLTTDGGRKTFELSVRPVVENGIIVTIQGIARDVTSRRELEAQLRQAQKMDAIGQLAAGVAHDFNNLLTVILGSCEAAAGAARPGDPLTPRLDDIRSAAERAASLTGQLLAFSRRQITTPVVVNLNAVITDVQRMLSRLIGEDIESCFEPDPALGFISADVGQIQQVLMNLAVNARDAMPGGGRFSIRTRNVRLDEHRALQQVRVPAGDYVALEVSDTGMGIDDQTRTRLFEPFFTTKEPGKGTGLGLATVYAIVKQSGGFIWVTSQPGAGATFQIYLPRVEAEAATPPAHAVEPTTVAGCEAVLLAEDEEDLREMLRDYLEGLGYEVRAACGGVEALEACVDEGFRPAILITDVVMPGLGGRAVADRLRARNPNLKVIFLSGYTDEAMLRHGRLPTGTQFIQKPFALQALARSVRQTLDDIAVACVAG